MNLGSIWDKLTHDERKFIHIILNSSVLKDYYPRKVTDIDYERLIFLDIDLVADVIEDYVKLTFKKTYGPNNTFQMKDLLAKLGKPWRFN